MLIILFTIYKYYHQDKSGLSEDSQQQILTVLQQTTGEPEKIIVPLS
jgi:hypothetical protein